MKLAPIAHCVRSHIWLTTGVLAFTPCCVTPASLLLPALTNTNLKTPTVARLCCWMCG